MLKAKAPKVEKGITLIASNTKVVGDLHFQDQLYVNGRVEGNLHADSGATLHVSEGGSVMGEVRVPNVIINGEVVGDVYGDLRVELAPKARVKGNVFYKLIEMQLGASVDGQLVHTDDVTSDSREVEGAKVHHLQQDTAGTPLTGDA